MGVLLGLLMAVPAAAPADTQDAERGFYRRAAGPCTVESRGNVVLKDAQRNKDLPLRVSFPQQDGKVPLIVWSHGMYGSKDGYQPLVSHWVSHGYVVIQPTHSDSLSLDPAEKRRAALSDLKLDRVQDWMNRPRDVRFLLDSLDELVRQVPPLAERMNRDRIGVGGHSYGAFTTQLLAGTKPRLLRRQSFADPRPAAFVVISGNGLGPLFDEESFSTVERPSLFLSGTYDKGRSGEEAEWRKHAYEHAAPGGKYLVWIDEAYHDFGGISGAPSLFRQQAGVRMGQPNSKHVDLVRSATLAFWDAMLKNDAAAKEYLTNKEIEQAQGVTLSTK